MDHLILMGHTGREVTEKALIVCQPKAIYPEEDRRNQITGAVVLRAGSLHLVRLEASLFCLDFLTLTERAIEAAKNIKFVPATKHRTSVSMAIQLEYNFSVH
jgi:hypothetical protein